MGKKQILYRQMFLEYGHKLWHGTRNYHINHGSLIAASSTFYAILSSLPILIAIVTVLSFLSGDILKAQTQVLDTTKAIFPQIAPWFFATIRNILSAQTSSEKINWVNIIVLAWAATGFINSIFHGIHILGKARIHRSLFIPLKSVLVLMVTVMASVMMIFLESNLIHGMIILLYFTFLFHFIMGSVIRFKDAILGALTFVILFFLAKLIFYFYLRYFRLSLVKNFGDFTAMVVAVLWVYFVMISFFLSASVALVRPKSSSK